MPALPIGVRTPPTCLGDRDHPGRAAGAAHGEPRLGRRLAAAAGSGSAVDNVMPASRQRDRALGQALAPLPERDVDRPVGATFLAVLGRAVERVDDPEPVGIVTAGVVGRLLGQDDVVGTGVGEQLRAGGRWIACRPRRAAPTGRRTRAPRAAPAAARRRWSRGREPAPRQCSRRTAVVACAWSQRPCRRRPSRRWPRR